MSRTTHPPTSFEDDIRAMLARRAADVTPSRPPLADLGRRAPVAGDTLGEPRPGRDTHRGVRARWRPLLALAAAIAVVVGAVGLVVSRGGAPDGPVDEPDVSTTRPPPPDPPALPDAAATLPDAATLPEPSSVPAPGVGPEDLANPIAGPATSFPVPGTAEFDRDPSVLADVLPGPDGEALPPGAGPEEVAATYLDAVELGGELTAVTGARPPTAGDVTTVEWMKGVTIVSGPTGPSVPDHPDAVEQGRVFVRPQAAGGSPAALAVVGSAPEVLPLADVRSDGDRVAFGVASTLTLTDGSPIPESVSVLVEVDGVPVSVGGTPMQYGEDPGPQHGEYVDAPAGSLRYLTVDVQPGQHVRILVRTVGGAFLSATDMAFVVPGPAG